MSAASGPQPARSSTPSRRAKVWLLFAVAGTIALAAGMFLGTREPREAAPSTEALFALSFPDAAGNAQPLAQWRGKVLVVNFWATWCGPCREEMPEFVKTQADLGGRGVQFVGIAADDAAKVQAYARELGLNYPALIGGYGAIELSKLYGNRLQALPFTIIVDRQGKIVHTQLGPLPPPKLRNILEQAL